MAIEFVAAWNALGLVLLVNVVTVAILGTPRFQYFGADRLNVWVTYPPFVWLPAVMVLVPWKRDDSHNSRAGHPASRRCSSLT